MSEADQRRLAARRRDHEQHKQMLRSGAEWIDGAYLDFVGRRREPDGSYTTIYRGASSDAYDETMRLEEKDGSLDSISITDAVESWKRRERKRQRKWKEDPRVAAAKLLGATLTVCGRCSAVTGQDAALDSWFWIHHSMLYGPVALCCSRACADLCLAARGEEDERIVAPLYGWERVAEPYEIKRQR